MFVPFFLTVLPAVMSSFFLGGGGGGGDGGGGVVHYAQELVQILVIFCVCGEGKMFGQKSSKK